MQLFKTSHPTQENAGEYYDGMTVSCYDDFNAMIKFVDPYHVAKVISKPAPAEDVNAETGEVNYGCLNVARDAAIFDIG